MLKANSEIMSGFSCSGSGSPVGRRQLAVCENSQLQMLIANCEVMSGYSGSGSGSPVGRRQSAVGSRQRAKTANCQMLNANCELNI